MPAWVDAQERSPVPVLAPVDTTRAITDARTAFNRITRENYLRRHAFSLDHFLEFEPGGVLARLGPIGNDAFYSRWGIGSGRAMVVLNGIPLNDPQDGRAPLAHIATSGLGTLTLDATAAQVYSPALDGSIALTEVGPRPSRPFTFIELSKGTNEVRQRRVRFGSQAGSVGIDLSYDEVLDDGYNFDANDVTFPGVPPEGRALSRNAAAVIRGDLGDETTYSVGLRRFRSSTTGDLTSAANEATKSGHLLWATVKAVATATVYGRGYTSERPDSAATNETVGGVVAWDARRGSAAVHLFALGEHTNASQRLARAELDARVNTGVVGASTELARGDFTLFADGSVAGDEKSWAWGAGAGLRGDLPIGNVTVSGRRTYRLPSLGERYAPEHFRDGLLLSGNQAVDAEGAWEGAAEWTLRAGGFTNRLRGSWVQSEDFIAFRPAGGDTLSRLALNSEATPTMMFVEERIGVGAMVGRFEVRGDAGGYYTSGDREGVFMSVPRTQINAALEVGTQLFEKSSALYLGGEYAFVDERSDYRGVLLPSYPVVNVSLVGRLLDARLSVRGLNLMDESYQTVSGYLMTPRTLAYGIEWTLFD